MEMEFNKKKFFALLKEKNKLAEEGKFFWYVDKYKYKELLGYFILLENQIFWQSRKEYCQILDLFVNEKITVDEFCAQFSDLRSSNLNASKLLQENLEAEACGILPKSNEIDFQLNPESRGFTKITSSINNFIELYNPDITFEMNLENPEVISYGISEDFLRLYFNIKLLPRIVKYCTEY